MFKIIIDDDILMNSASGNYTCGMYCLTSQGFFPGEKWVDFAGILIFEWAEAIISACRFQDTHFKLSFMDGPYEIVGYRDHKMANLKLYRIENRGRILKQTENIEIFELVKTMYQAVIRLKKILFLHGYEDEESKLERLKAELKRIMQQMKSDNKIQTNLA